VAAARLWACASWSGSCTPLPSHHGQGTVCGSPPLPEMTVPVPRQGEHGVGAGACVSVVSVTGRRA